MKNAIPQPPPRAHAPSRPFVGTFHDREGMLSVAIQGQVRIYLIDSKQMLLLETDKDGVGFSIEDFDKEPGRSCKYRAVMGLEPDGTLRGWYIDAKTERRHFQGPAEGKSIEAAIAAGKPWRPLGKAREKKPSPAQPATKRKAKPQAKKAA